MKPTLTSKLALFGGSPIFEPALDFKALWPPVDEGTATQIRDLYFSRKWTAFDEAEPAFAQAFASYHGAQYGVFTVNGTVTLQIALAAYGIGPGDEVIVPPLTWYATAIAVRHVRATPVFVDIDPATLCIDPQRVEAAITPRTKAIIPVHAYGSLANMDALMSIAAKHGLKVIEDCAHVPGGAWDGRGVGSVGHIGSFSFQHTKTMSSGEGGICITSDPKIADRLFRMKQIGYGHGEVPRSAKVGPPSDLLCYNFRATAFHPVILQGQLAALEGRLTRYRRAVDYLEHRLSASTRLRFQKLESKITRHGRFGWVLIFDDPQYADIPIETIHQAITAEGLPLYRAEGPIYRFVLFNVDPKDYRIDQECPVTENTCRRSLWLLHPFLGLEASQLDKIAEALEKILQDPIGLTKVRESRA